MSGPGRRDRFGQRSCFSETLWGLMQAGSVCEVEEPSRKEIKAWTFGSLSISVEVLGIGYDKDCG